MRKPRGALTPEKRLAYEDAVARKARQLVVRVVLPGEWYLVRWGGTRKGSGTFYTRPGLAVPTVQRTLRPLAYDPPHGAGRHARPRRAARRVDAEDARGDPRAQGLRPGLRLRHLPGRGAALPHRGALRVAPPPRPHRRRTASAPSCGCSRARAADGRAARSGSARSSCPCRPDDALFEPRLKAILRRHVVERCIYGVDLDPLAVELCRLALWIETMDRTLPFSFLDHKIKCGNSARRRLVRPVPALPGDGLEEPRGRRQEPQQRRALREGGADQGDQGVRQGHADARPAALPRGPHALLDERPAGAGRRGARRGARRRSRACTTCPSRTAPSAPASTARSCSARRPTGRSRRRWTSGAPAGSGRPTSSSTRRCRRRLPRRRRRPAPSPSASRRDKRFFHWELEFPDVFRAAGSGFDAMLGNPPWEIAKPNSKEFFSNIDPLYRVLRQAGGAAATRPTTSQTTRHRARLARLQRRLPRAVELHELRGEPVRRSGRERDERRTASRLRAGKENDVLHARWRDARGEEPRLRRSGASVPPSRLGGHQPLQALPRAGACAAAHGRAARASSCPRASTPTMAPAACASSSSTAAAGSGSSASRTGTRIFDIHRSLQVQPRHRREGRHDRGDPHRLHAPQARGLGARRGACHALHPRAGRALQPALEGHPRDPVARATSRSSRRSTRTPCSSATTAPTAGASSTPARIRHDQRLQALPAAAEVGGARATAPTSTAAGSRATGGRSPSSGLELGVKPLSTRRAPLRPAALRHAPHPARGYSGGHHPLARGGCVDAGGVASRTWRCRSTRDE